MEKIKLSSPTRCSIIIAGGGVQHDLNHLMGSDGYMNNLYGVSPQNEAHLAFLTQNTDYKNVWSTLWDQDAPRAIQFQAQDLKDIVERGRYDIICTDTDDDLLQWEGDLFVRLKTDSALKWTERLTARYSECYIVRGFTDLYMMCQSYTVSFDKPKNIDLIISGISTDDLIDSLFNILEDKKIDHGDRSTCVDYLLSSFA